MEIQNIKLVKEVNKTSQNAGWYYFFFLPTEASFKLKKL